MWQPVYKWRRYRNLPGGMPRYHAIGFLSVVLAVWLWLRSYDGSGLVARLVAGVFTAWAIEFVALEFLRLFRGSREPRSET